MTSSHTTFEALEGQPLVLVVDDDPTFVALVESWLEEESYTFSYAKDGQECLAALTKSLPDAMLLDLQLPGMGGLEVLDLVERIQPNVPVLVITSDDHVETVVSAMQMGAHDYLVKPIRREKLLATLRNAVEQRQMSLRIARLEREVRGGRYPGILGRSKVMESLFYQLDRVASSLITVLISGESGVGKELVARALHDHSPHHAGPFVALNCAAVPENLLESELFGHERGAFTGAAKRKRGLVEQAHGGTLLLDEVAELTPALQAKLLRVLQEKSYRRVGGEAVLKSDFRLLAATHRDLREQARQGRFREDLYFRLAVFELAVPPLRERDGDIPLLARKFIEEFATKPSEQGLGVSREAWELLLAHTWPGNVRELQSAIQRALLLVSGETITPNDLPPTLSAGRALATNFKLEPVRNSQEEGKSGVQSLEEIERRAIEEALARTNGNLTDVVRQLGIGRTTLYRKLKKYGLR